MGGGENTPPVPELVLLSLRFGFAISELNFSSLLGSEALAYNKKNKIVKIISYVAITVRNN